MPNTPATITLFCAARVAECSGSNRVAWTAFLNGQPVKAPDVATVLRELDPMPVVTSGLDPDATLRAIMHTAIKPVDARTEATRGIDTERLSGSDPAAVYRPITTEVMKLTAAETILIAISLEGYAFATRSPRALTRWTP